MQLCEECGKRPATVHLTQISEKGMAVTHLCEKCAQAKGITVSIEGANAPEAGREKKPAPEDEKRCSVCGITYGEFREQGRLGCRYCYRAFAEEIDKMLVEMHGSCTHRGKRYSRVGSVQGTESDIARLRNELHRAVREEDFEEAARLRDTINAISPLD